MNIIIWQEGKEWRVMDNDSVNRVMCCFATKKKALAFQKYLKKVMS